MAALNPYAAGYRTQPLDLASSSPVFRPVADATSSPSPPSSPIPANTGDLAEQSFRSSTMLRPRTPPRISDLSPPFAVSDAFEPPIFTSSSPSLDQGSAAGSATRSTLSNSPTARTSLEFSSSSYTSTSSSDAASAMMNTQLKSAADLTHPLSAHNKASSLTAHPSFGKTHPHTKHPHPESPNRKRGLKRPLPLSPDKPSLRTLGGLSTFQPTASGSSAGRRMKRSVASLSTGLTSDDELALDLTTSARTTARNPRASYARDDVFRTMFADTSDSSDESSWPDSSSPPRQAADVDESFAPMEEDTNAEQDMVLSMPIDVDTAPLLRKHSPSKHVKAAMTSNRATAQAGLGLSPAIDLATPRPSGPANPYRRSISKPFSRIPSSGPPHPLSASYVPSPPAQSPAHSRPRLHSPTRQADDAHLRGRGNDLTARFPSSPLFSGHMRDDSASSSSGTWKQGGTPRPTHSEKSVWAQVANDVFEQCQTSIVLDGRGLTYIDPIVADLGKMVTLPPPRKSPPRDATPGSSSKRRSLEAVAEMPEVGGWIPSLKFGGLQLNLANNRLTVLPSALFQVENLRVLSLRGNNIKFLPPAISELANLRELSIGGNKIEYLPAEIQKLRLTTFNYFPNPWRKPSKSLSCASSSDEGPNKTCVHEPRFRVRPTWEQLTLMSNTERVEMSPTPTAPVPAAPERPPVRQKPAGLSLRPLLLTNLSFGQIGLSTEELRTPSNPSPDDPLDGATPLAGSSSSNASDQGARRMAPPPAPFRVSEQGPRFANAGSSSTMPSALHTPTRIDEGSTMGAMQLGAIPVPTVVTPSSSAQVEPPDVRDMVPAAPSRTRVFDRTRSELQIREVLDAYPGSGPMLGPEARATMEAHLSSRVAVAPAARPSNTAQSAGNGRQGEAGSLAGSGSGSYPTSTTAPTGSGPIHIENGRASYAGPTEIVVQGFPPLLGELCYRLLLSPSSSVASDSNNKRPDVAGGPQLQTTRQEDEKRPSRATQTPELVLDRWDRDELARLRQAQDSAVLRTLEAARRSAGRSWGGDSSEAERSLRGVKPSPVGGLELEEGLDSEMSDGRSHPGGTDGGAFFAEVRGAECLVGDAGADASANPWFSRCPNPAHASVAPVSNTITATASSSEGEKKKKKSTSASPRTSLSPSLSSSNGTSSSDWPVPPAQRNLSPLFHRPAETRLEWVSHVAGLRIARVGFNTSVIPGPFSAGGNNGSSDATGSGSAGQVVSEEDCLPLLWRGCSKGCLGFLDR
ncbi:unnamed protein product [Tilletia controversa]|nr:unnamed protein product [Tilletia controversa]CAD6978792.1 unnamed protein product [Tilletia controversa]